MKKLLVFIIALLVSSVMYGQAKDAKKEAKHFFAFHAGPSFPVGNYKSTTLLNTSTGLFEDRESGFAKTGFNAGVNYQYQVIKNFGVAAGVFYNNNKLNTGAFVDQINQFFGGEINATGLKLDHWQWYGLTVGPALTENLSNNILADLRVMGGIANANSPKAVFNSIKIAGEDWSIAPVFQAGINVRFNVGNNMFIITNADYQYLRPKFTVEYNLDGTLTEEKTKQKMEVFNVTAGIGINF